MKTFVAALVTTFVALLIMVVVTCLQSCQPQPIIVMVPGAGSSSAKPYTIPQGTQPSPSAQAFDIFLKIQQVVCNGDPLPVCIEKIKLLTDTLAKKPTTDGGVR